MCESVARHGLVIFRTRHLKAKMSEPAKNPFDMLVEQIREVVREEISGGKRQRTQLPCPTFRRASGQALGRAENVD